MTLSEGLASLGTRARLARGFLLVHMLSIVVGLVGGFIVGFLVTTGSLPPVAIPGLLTASALIGTVLILVLAFAIPFWTYRAWANLHAMRLTGLTFSPGWAAGSFFVPLVNLFVPFLAMRELYNRSLGEDEHQAKASAPDVASWWACFVAANLVQAFLLAVALFNLNGMVFIVIPPLANLVTLFFLIALVLGAQWFLYRTIGKITDAQCSYAGLGEAFA